MIHQVLIDESERSIEYAYIPKYKAILYPYQIYYHLFLLLQSNCEIVKQELFLRELPLKVLDRNLFI